MLDKEIIAMRLRNIIDIPNFTDRREEFKLFLHKLNHGYFDLKDKKSNITKWTRIEVLEKPNEKNLKELGQLFSEYLKSDEYKPFLFTCKVDGVERHFIFCPQI